MSIRLHSLVPNLSAESFAFSATRVYISETTTKTHVQKLRACPCTYVAPRSAFRLTVKRCHTKGRRQGDWTRQKAKRPWKTRSLTQRPIQAKVVRLCVADTYSAALVPSRGTYSLSLFFCALLCFSVLARVPDTGMISGDCGLLTTEGM